MHYKKSAQNSFLISLQTSPPSHHSNKFTRKRQHFHTSIQLPYGFIQTVSHPISSPIKHHLIFPDPPAKIPRPMNAFMLFANANRKLMAQIHPNESNKDISKRLGMSWRSLSVTEKAIFFRMARSIDEEHKKKYPRE